MLSYEEAAELAYFGAKVLHPKTIKPAVDHHIPVRVCNTFEPDEIGTMVLAESGEAPNKIKSIAHKKNITVVRITSARMLGAYGFMTAVFQVFDRHRTVIDVISTSEVSVALTLDSTDSLEAVITDLKRSATSRSNPVTPSSASSAKACGPAPASRRRSFPPSKTSTSPSSRMVRRA